MNSKQRKDEYLAKAKEADENAEKTKDCDVAEIWPKIAKEYRELAALQ